MKKAKKTGKLIQTRMVCKFNKRSKELPCSGNTIDPTTITTTTTTGIF